MAFSGRRSPIAASINIRCATSDEIRLISVRRLVTVGIGRRLARPPAAGHYQRWLAQ